MKFSLTTNVILLVSSATVSLKYNFRSKPAKLTSLSGGIRLGKSEFLVLFVTIGVIYETVWHLLHFFYV